MIALAHLMLLFLLGSLGTSFRFPSSHSFTQTCRPIAVLRGTAPPSASRIQQSVEDSYAESIQGYKNINTEIVSIMDDMPKYVLVGLVTAACGALIIEVSRTLLAISIPLLLILGGLKSWEDRKQSKIYDTELIDPGFEYVQSGEHLKLDELKDKARALSSELGGLDMLVAEGKLATKPFDFEKGTEQPARFQPLKQALHGLAGTGNTLGCWIKKRLARSKKTEDESITLDLEGLKYYNLP